jgi:hypothetical protein
MLRLRPDGVPEWLTEQKHETELGILKLAGEDLPTESPDWLRHWQRLAKEFLRSTLLASRQHTASLPSEVQLLAWQAEAPVGPAFVHGSAAALLGLWQRLQAAFTEWTERHGNVVEQAVAAIAPKLVECGQVTFHLVENKQSQEFPFAFVGTCTHLGKEGRLTQVPIGKVLREAAKLQDVAALRGVLEPLKQAVQSDAFLADLVDTQRIFQALAFTPTEAFSFLKATPALAEAGIATRIPNWWHGKKGNRPQVLVTLEEDEAGSGTPQNREAKEGGGFLKFNVHVALRGEQLSPEELQAILETDAPLVSLKGQWVELDAARLRSALGLWQKATAAQAQGIPLLVGLRWLAGGAAAATPQLGEQAAATNEWTELAAGEQLQQRLTQFRSADVATGWPYGDEPPDILARLRPYQLQGVQWLWAHARQSWGACLADDMGLGKTLQVISLISTRMRRACDYPRSSWPQRRC